MKIEGFYNKSMAFHEMNGFYLILQGIRDSGLGTGEPGLGTRDSGLGTRDLGLGTRDSGLGTRDSGLGTRGLGTRGLANSHISSEMGLFFFTKIL